jgi:hypothetical protein
LSWSADIVSEPSRNHELCIDLFEGGVHRARLRRNERRELELVCYEGEFTIPADWLVGIIQRFVAETGSARGEGGA